MLPGTTYLVTRRCTQQQFFLRPSREINNCIRFCIARAQKRSKVQLHSIKFLSNHYHIVLTDPARNLPIFTEELDRLLACALNTLHGRRENFWEANIQPSCVRLEAAGDVLHKTIYTLTNATAAFLVSRGSEWPGVLLYRKGIYRAKRPKFFFSTKRKGGLPDEESFELTPPPIGVADNEADDYVKDRVSAWESILRQKARALGRKFMGAAAVKAKSIYTTAATKIKRIASRDERRGEFSPWLACIDKERRLEVLDEFQRFLDKYDKARRARLEGKANVIFPAGTYRLARDYGIRCEDF